jgi:hypothetical protein
LVFLAIVRWDIGNSLVRINFGDHAMSRRVRPLAGGAARKSFLAHKVAANAPSRLQNPAAINQGAGAGEETVMFELKKFLNLNSFRAMGAAFADFDKILNWKLLRGSHVFPGPDGGTCVNEAAIVAAGHPYRAVRSIEDCPPSFSRPVATYALFLNDLIEDDALRARILMPFVTRLEGAADTEAEKARAELIVLRTASAILAPALLRLGCFDASEKLRAIGSAYDLIGLAQGQFGGPESRLAPPSWMNQALSELADAAYACLRNDFVGAAKCAAIAAANVAQGMQQTSRRRDHRALARVYHQAGDILDSALKLGKQGDAIGIAEAAERLDRAKRRAAPAGLVAMS